MELKAKIVGVTHIKCINSIQRFLFFSFFFLLLQKGNGVDNRQQKQKEIKVIITTTFWTLLYRSEPSTEHDKYILSLTFFVNNHHG